MLLKSAMKHFVTPLLAFSRRLRYPQGCLVHVVQGRGKGRGGQEGCEMGQEKEAMSAVCDLIRPWRRVGSTAQPCAISNPPFQAWFTDMDKLESAPTVSLVKVRVDSLWLLEFILGREVQQPKFPCGMQQNLVRIGLSVSYWCSTWPHWLLVCCLTA